MIKKIVICTTQRSGSTMICEDFRNTKVLGMPAEHFLSWYRLIKRKKVNIESIDWNQRLSQIINQSQTENGIASFKIMANQVRKIDQCLSCLDLVSCSSTNKRKFTVFHSFFQDAFWIRVYRRDKVRQAISSIIARKTGICHAIANPEEDHFPGGLMKGYRENYNQAVHLSVEEIDTTIKKIKNYELLWNEFFDQYNIEPFVICYEDVCQTGYKYLYEIANRVNVKISQNMPERKLVKLSNSVNEYWLRKYEDKKADNNLSSNTVGYSLKKANRLCREGTVNEAIAEYYRAIKLNPNFSWSYHLLGEALLKQGKLDEAANQYSHALKLSPNCALHYYRIGEILTLQGDISEAAKYFEKAIEINPTIVTCNL